MKILQVSVFLEKQSGHLADMLKIIAEAGIHVIAMSQAEASDFRIVRLWFAQSARALELLTEAGYVARLVPAVAIPLEDRPGAILPLLKTVQEEGLELGYLYSFAYGAGHRGIAVLRFDDPDHAIERLEARGIPATAPIPGL